MQVLQVPPHVILHQRRNENKVLAVGSVSVLLGSWGLSSHYQTKAWKIQELVGLLLAGALEGPRPINHTAASTG